MHPRRSHRLAFAAIVAGTLSGTAYFVIGAITELNAAPFEAISADDGPTLPPLPSEPTPGELGRAMLARNIFDSATGPVAWEAPRPPPEPARQTEPEPVALARCASPELRLLASVVVARTPERSLAILRRGDDTHVVQVGGAVGDAQLLALSPSHALVRAGDDTPCTVPLFLPMSERPRVSAASEPRSPRQARARRQDKKELFSAAELDAGIRSAGPGRFAVQRSLLERGLTAPAALIRGARFVHSRVAGRQGMKVYGLRKGSVLRRLGVRNGDVVRTLNGFDIASADGLLQGYMQLKQQDTFTLSLLRKGKPSTLTYQLE
jgi:hypothetical protein